MGPIGHIGPITARDNFQNRRRDHDFPETMLHYALSCFISLQLNFHRYRPGNYTPPKSESDSDAKNWCH